MDRDRTVPGNKLLIYVGSAIGLTRAAEQAIAEAGAPVDKVAPTTRAEGSDVNPKLVWRIGVGVLVTVWVIVLLCYPLLQMFKYQRTGGADPRKVLMEIPNLPPEPRDDSDPVQHLDEFRAREQYALDHYSWVDRSKGLVSIPIEQAMRMVVERGIPPTKAAAGQYFPPQAASMRTGSVGKVEPQ